MLVASGVTGIAMDGIGFIGPLRGLVQWVIGNQVGHEVAVDAVASLHGSLDERLNSELVDAAGAPHGGLEQLLHCGIGEQLRVDGRTGQVECDVVGRVLDVECSSAQE
jgi:hypothetical protein